MLLIETEVRQLKQTKAQRRKVMNSLDTIGPNEVRRKEAEKIRVHPLHIVVLDAAYTTGWGVSVTV